MINYSFYHFLDFEKPQALVALLENIAVKQKKKIRLMIAQDEQQEYDNMLWSRKQLSFIPHNIEGEDTFKTKVYITSKPHCADFAEDAVLSITPEPLQNIKVAKALYLVTTQQLGEFKALFNQLKNEGHQCSYHAFASNAWVTRDAI